MAGTDWAAKISGRSEYSEGGDGAPSHRRCIRYGSVQKLVSESRSFSEQEIAGKKTAAAFPSTCGIGVPCPTGALPREWRDRLPIWSCVRKRQPQSSSLLQGRDNLEQILCLRIPLGAQHAHKALCRLVRQGAQFFEADGRIDVIPQNRLARFEFARKETLDALAQEFVPECRIGLDSRLNCTFEFPR